MNASPRKLERRTTGSKVLISLIKPLNPEEMRLRSVEKSIVEKCMRRKQELSAGDHKEKWLFDKKRVSAAVPETRPQSTHQSVPGLSPRSSSKPVEKTTTFFLSRSSQPQTVRNVLPFSRFDSAENSLNSTTLKDPTFLPTKRTHKTLAETVELSAGEITLNQPETQVATVRFPRARILEAINHKKLLKEASILNEKRPASITKFEEHPKSLHRMWPKKSEENITDSKNKKQAKSQDLKNRKKIKVMYKDLKHAFNKRDKKVAIITTEQGRSRCYQTTKSWREAPMRKSQSFQESTKQSEQ